MRWVAVAAAAVLAIAMAGPWLRSATRTTASPDVERARAVASGNGAIVVLTPADGDTISPARAVFSWRGRGPDVLYRVSLTDGRGQAIWTTDTPDTSAVLPPNVRLAAGTRYFWYVDALGANATSWTTGTRAFVVSP